MEVVVTVTCLFHQSFMEDVMANSKQISINGSTENKKSTGNSILLRLSPRMAEEVRNTAKREERTITTVVTRALKHYIKSEYQIEIQDSE